MTELRMDGASAIIDTGSSGANLSLTAASTGVIPTLNLTAGGNVGIGVTAPDRKLHIYGNNDVGTMAISSSLAALNNWNGIEFGYSGTRKAGIFFER